MTAGYGAVPMLLQMACYLAASIVDAIRDIRGYEGPSRRIEVDLKRGIWYRVRISKSKLGSLINR